MQTAIVSGIGLMHRYSMELKLISCSEAMFDSFVAT